MRVIPALNCADEESVSRRLMQMSEFLPAGDWIHLDVSDGNFTFAKTWNDPVRWRELAGRYGWRLEVHAMVEKPESVLGSWFEAGAERAIVHLEALAPDSLKKICERAAQSGAEVMLSSNPETSPEIFRPYLDGEFSFQALAVNPGLSGQKFLPLVLEKVKFLRAHRPDVIIEVDGGINPETARMSKEAGADAVVASSYLFWGSDPKGAWEELMVI